MAGKFAAEGGLIAQMAGVDKPQRLAQGGRGTGVVFEGLQGNGGADVELAVFFAPRLWSIPRPRADRDALEAAARLLKTAKKPLIISGGGVRYSQLRGNARRSPLAVKPDNYGISLGLAYRCCR